MTDDDLIKELERVKTYMIGSHLNQIMSTAIDALEAKQWQLIDENTPKNTQGSPVFLQWQGKGFEPAKGHREEGVWGELNGDMSFTPYPTQPTHYLPLTALPTPPTEDE
jgi:hypothetical protein